VSCWRWAAAACRGISHEKSGTRLQDAYSCFVPQGCSSAFVGLISDGAGSAQYGGEGASLICRTVGGLARAHFREKQHLPDETAILEWIDAARDRISAVATRRGACPRDFAGTLVGMISDAEATVVFHVGDGGVVVRQRHSGAWIAASWPDHGEYASTTSFVTDDTGARARIVIHSMPINAVALFSDGLERLALRMADNQPHPPFFDGMFRPLFTSTVVGRDASLSHALNRFLASPSVNERTDDDKSLILAARS
jgi:hypothetical protein